MRKFFLTLKRVASSFPPVFSLSSSLKTSFGISTDVSVWRPAISATRHLVSPRSWISQFVSNTISSGAVGVDRVTVQGIKIDRK